MSAYYSVNNVKVDVAFIREHCSAHPDGLHQFPVWFDHTEAQGIVWQFFGNCVCGRVHGGVQGRRWQEIPPDQRHALLVQTVQEINGRSVQA